MLEYQHNNWEITARRSLFDLKLKDTWHYRDLLLLLVRRDFVAFYKQTILGPLWFFIQPLFTTIIFTFIFGIARISTDDVPAPLFYMAGITAWNYFADCITKTSTVFKDNAAIFGKVYFPRLIMPLSIVLSNLVRFGVQFLLFILFMLYYGLIKHSGFHPNLYILLFPLLILLMGLLGLGAGMIISALTTKYRDLAFLITFGVQLMMYASAVIIPLSATPAKYKWIIQANPMTTIIEAFRYGFLGKGTVTWGSMAYTIIFTLATLITGLIIFNKVEKNFVDTV
jgi:lipopolysaccharide transport system permease protein